MAPGQLSFEHMTQVYRYDQINAETEVYGVVADPIGHSLSPLIQNAGFAHLGLNKVYVPFRVPREDLGRFIDEAESLGIRGLSITIPHKEEVIKKLTQGRRSGSRHRGGQHGVVQRPGAGRLQHRLSCRHVEPGRGHGAFFRRREIACRQDGPGDGLRRRGHGHHLRPGLPRGQRAGERHRPKRAEVLAARFNCQAVDWADRHKANPDILINSTPVGMHPNVDETPYEKHHLRPSMVVFDAVYNPENTLLIKDARSRNCTVVTGIEMFVRQACLQFKFFTGHDGPADLMRKVIRRTIGAVRV